MISRKPPLPLSPAVRRDYPTRPQPSPGATQALWNAVLSGCPTSAQNAIDKGASVNGREPHGGLNPISPLDRAVLEDKPAVLSVLLKNGARLTRNRQGLTAAHAAARMANGCVAVLERAGRMAALTPLTHNGAPPLAFVLSNQSGPVERRQALVERWLSRPLDWTLGTAAHVLSAACDAHPASMLDWLLATGLKPPVLTGELNPLRAVIDRWSPNSPDSHSHQWLVALTQAGVGWPEGAPMTSVRVAQAHAAYLQVRLHSTLDAPERPAAKPRL